MRQVTLSDINRDATYDGYLWLSDATEPVVLDGEKLDSALLEQENPFVIEAQLYDAAGSRSYAVRYADGRHVVTEFDADDINAAGRVTEKCFVPLRIKHRGLHFKQLWSPRGDELCEGMPVLEPVAMIFVGFNDGGQ